MLREVRARWVAVLTVVLVVLLAALFSQLRQAQGRPGSQRPSAPPASPATSPPVAPSAARPAPAGAAPQALADDVALEEFARLGCAGCHAIRGHGNPARPLDGVGARRDSAAIREWSTGEGAAADELSAAVLRRKARAAGDPALPALLDWLAGQR